MLDSSRAKVFFRYDAHLLDFKKWFRLKLNLEHTHIVVSRVNYYFRDLL